ncbi:hypothetical protein [Sphingosinithalassobacter portus]|uniref:hypothetical protein n=1 Tax=Stakelama portus TaxID=2676234 RepID=UPI000D6E0E08|nr:hypothetical protein [Sphingosinithalassobacter portus]
MAASALFVLNIAETGLRSILAARLSLLGVDVISIRDLDDRALARMVRKRTILVLDDDTLARLPDGDPERLLAQPRWSDIIIISQRSPDDAKHGDRIRYMPRAEAAVQIVELVERWLGAS